MISIFETVKNKLKKESCDFYMPLHFYLFLAFSIRTKSKNYQKEFTKVRVFFFIFFLF